MYKPFIIHLSLTLQFRFILFLVLVDLTKISILLTPVSFMAKSNIRLEARNVQKYIGLWMEYDTLRRAPSERKSLARYKQQTLAHYIKYRIIRK